MALPGLPGLESRGFAWLELRRSGHKFVAISTHLGLNHQERLWQTEFLCNWLVKQATPVILAGDLNTEPHSPEHTLLSIHAHDLTCGSELLTFPSDVPSRQIDYIFATSPLRGISAEVLNGLESDHCPVVVKIRF